MLLKDTNLHTAGIKNQYIIINKKKQSTTRSIEFLHELPSHRRTGYRT